MKFYHCGIREPPNRNIYSLFWIAIIPKIGFNICFKIQITLFLFKEVVPFSKKQNLDN